MSRQSDLDNHADQLNPNNERQGRQRSYNSGRLALCLLTLVKADVAEKIKG